MVVYSVHEDGDKVRQAMQAGAFGYVTKREDPDLLLVALHHARRGERYLSPRGSRAMAESVASGPGLDPRELLSPQEMEVFVLTGRGHAIPDMAEKMNLSVRTVETYLGRIIEKLGMGGRRELRLFASEWLRKEAP
jgi:two-component system invasion response regulator UvrY